MSASPEVSIKGSESGPINIPHVSRIDVLRENISGWLPRFHSKSDALKYGALPLTLAGAGMASLAASAFAQVENQDNPSLELALANLGLSLDTTEPAEIAQLPAVELPIFPTLLNPFYRPTVRLEDGMGYVATDNLRITHVYDDVSANWNELEKYIPIGTTQERMKRSLQDFLGTNTVDDGAILDNPLGLDPNEVTTYLATGKAEGFKSFRILPNSKGEPAIILVTGSPYGIQGDNNKADVITEAVKRLNNADPKIIDILTIQFGLRAISADEAPGGFFDKAPDSYRATISNSYDRRLGIMFYKTGHTSGYAPSTHMGLIIGEARGIYNSNHIIRIDNKWVVDAKDKLSDNELMDKALWSKQWIESAKKNLSAQDYRGLTLGADSLIDIFSRPPFA